MIRSRSSRLFASDCVDDSFLHEEDAIVDRQPLVLSPCRSSTKRNRAELNHVESTVSINENENLSPCDSNAMEKQVKGRRGGREERGYFRYVAVDCKPGRSFATRFDGIVDGNLAGVIPPCRFIGDVSSIISKREPTTLSRRVQLRPKFVLLCSTRPRYSGRDRERLKMIDISLKINGPRCVLTKLIWKFAYAYYINES